MPLLALIVLFVGVPLVEIAVIIRIADAIGLPATLGLMVLDAIVGSMLMRSQGRAAWRRFTAALAAGRAPGREVLDGGLIIFGGALLMAPGFVTDILGALFLAPPTRAAIRRMLARRLGRGLVLGALGGVAGARRRRDRAAGGPRDPGYDVDGTAVEAPRQSLER